jgi:hypothetical protein
MAAAARTRVSKGSVEGDQRKSYVDETISFDTQRPAQFLTVSDVDNK